MTDTISEDLETQESEESTTSDDIRDILDNGLTEIEPEAQEADEPQEASEPEYKASFNGYNDEQKTVLASLPSDVQRIIDERETKFHQGIEKYKSEAEFARTINKTLSQERELFEQNNMQPEQYIQSLVNVERQLRSDNLLSRVQAIHAIAASYGVDINALSQVPFDERTYRIEQENINLKQHYDSQRYTETQGEHEQLVEFIEEFSSKHEHFNELSNEIGQILSAGLAEGNTPQEKLQSAYEKAARLNNAVFEKTNQLSKAKDNNAIAQKVKQTAVQIKGAPVSGATKKVNNATVYDAVSTAFDALGF